jgi:DNA-binding transcriptional LysR family regulator
MRCDPRLLRSFVVLAEELHFGRAAARLAVAQPAVSQQIQRLERQLDVRLFDRTRQSVELTDAGRAALPAARRAVEAAAAVEAIAAGLARGDRGRLRVGLSPGAHYVAQAALERFQRRRPQVRIEATHDSSGALARRIAAGDLDIGIGFCSDAGPDVLSEHLCDEPAVLAVPASHRLAGEPSVRLDRLSGERFALVDAVDGPGYNRAVVARCRGAGFEPRVAARPHGPMAWETAIRAEGCVGLTTRSAAPATARGVRLVPLDPPVSFPLELLRPAEDAHAWPPVAVAFAEAARGVAGASHTLR